MCMCISSAHILSVLAMASCCEDGDWMEVRYEGFGRALRNPIRIETKDANRLVSVRSLA